LSYVRFLWIADLREYLKSQSSTFAQIDGINDVADIDEQPGYLQIFATDSEGDLVNISEYLEYKLSSYYVFCRFYMVKSKRYGPSD
jgi:hypothetical protein